ncbi:MAG: DUF6036 family nucleotidyltransferase [bacterium]
MNRHQLEHILRASGAITDETEIVILGSQSILGQYPEPPEALCRSMEADAYPLHAPDKADLIDGTIGELSPFHETHGYYAHGITPETTVLAAGWQSRLVRLQTPLTQGVVGLCLAPIDLAISKLAACREKDLAFVRIMLESHLIDPEEVCELMRTLPDAERARTENAWRCVSSV